MSLFLKSRANVDYISPTYHEELMTEGITRFARLSMVSTNFIQHVAARRVLVGSRSCYSIEMNVGGCFVAEY